jgi:NitT/TauT family transport system substrate-binding protein
MIYLRLFVMIALWLLSAACIAPVQMTGEQTAASPRSLRVALLPITDVVPFYVAQQEGYFADAGLDAVPVPVSSGAERDTVVQAGAAECELTDIHGVVLTNARNANDLRIIATARQATSVQPLFFMLSSPASGIERTEQLAGANIGISENTVIDYWNDRILESAGVDPTSVTRTNVPQIPVRLELLLNNQLDAVVLPDPLASFARLQGARSVVDDTIRPEIAVSVLACREDAIAQQPEAIAAFVSGWDRAVDAINADPSAFSNVLIENTRVPEPLQDRYLLPSFPVQKIPSEAQVEDVVWWALDKGLIETSLSYSETVDPSFRQ